MSFASGCIIHTQGTTRLSLVSRSIRKKRVVKRDTIILGRGGQGRAGAVRALVVLLLVPLRIASSGALVSFYFKLLS